MDQKIGVSLSDIIKEFVTPDGTGIFRAVDNVSIDINEGEFITLLGPSGCGKTTILRMIAGFEMPTSGDIYFGDKKVNHLSPDKRDSTMVFQSYALFPHYNVFDNIAYGLKNKKLSHDTIKEKVKSILELVGLESLESRNTNQLSGGQQQRVALARALVMEPGVLLFDEPLSNLDAKLRVYMRSEIRKIQRRIGLTSIYVTHDQDEAMSLSDRIIVMNKGIIEQVGTPHEIYQKPVNRFVAEFIGKANFIPATVEEKTDDKVTVKVFDGLYDVPVMHAKDIKEKEEVYAVLRPEAVEVGENGIAKGTVLSSTYMGSVQEYTIDVSGVVMELEQENPAGKKVFREGDDAFINFSQSNLHIIKK